MERTHEQYAATAIRADLIAKRQRVLSEKMSKEAARAQAEKDLWAVRMPTVAGLADAICSIFNLAATPLSWFGAAVWQSRLFASVEAQDAGMARKAILSGADIRAEKDRAFLTAVFNNDVTTARLLFIHGADPDMHQGLPLVLATIKGHADMASSLMDEMDASLETSVFLDPHEYGHEQGNELMALMTPSFGFNHKNPVLDMLRERGLVTRKNPEMHGTFAFHTFLRATAVELRHGKISFADGTTLYLDPAQQEAADAASTYFRKRRLIPPHSKPLQRI